MTVIFRQKDPAGEKEKKALGAVEIKKKKTIK